MPNVFPIVQVSPDAPEEAEAMGTKEKFWFHDRDRSFSIARKQTLLVFNWNVWQWCQPRIR